jgi:hypothetical protein
MSRYTFHPKKKFELVQQLRFMLLCFNVLVLMFTDDDRMRLKPVAKYSCESCIVCCVTAIY